MDGDPSATAVPWTVTDPMLERAKLVALHAEGAFSVTELALRAGVSRNTAYKWIARYRAGAADALAGRSHARHDQDQGKQQGSPPCADVNPDSTPGLCPYTIAITSIGRRGAG